MAFSSRYAHIYYPHGREMFWVLHSNPWSVFIVYFDINIYTCGLSPNMLESAYSQISVITCLYFDLLVLTGKSVFAILCGSRFFFHIVPATMTGYHLFQLVEYLFCSYFFNYGVCENTPNLPKLLSKLVGDNWADWVYWTNLVKLKTGFTYLNFWKHFMHSAVADCPNLNTAWTCMAGRLRADGSFVTGF